MVRLLSVASARPNFVKLAAVHHALAGSGDAGHLIVHTGQHYDALFSDVFFEQLAIPAPEVNLGVHGGTRDEVIDRTDAALRPLLRSLRPEMVLVYGDVNGALGAARAARHEGIKVAHVEAGLRSFDLSMPEELNRVGIDDIADLLLCSEKSGMENLAKEGVRGKAELVGNTMIDTLVRMRPAIAREPLVEEAKNGPFAIATLHRPSNVDDPIILASVLRFLGEVGEQCPVLLPVHHRLDARLDEFDLEGAVLSGLRLIEPLAYLPFLRAVEAAAFVLTDSGGIQEEATFLGKRCFTLRRNTERPSTVESGSNVLVDPAVDADRRAVLRYAANPVAPQVRVPPLWDGQTGERIVDRIRSFLHA
jgi:UDP-N-acetylglucosamine 2-epimerase (non-hydrolysing)